MTRSHSRSHERRSYRKCALELRPVAQLAPVPADADSLFGYMKDTMRVVGDVIAPLGLEWSALSGADRIQARTSLRIIAAGMAGVALLRVLGTRYESPHSGQILSVLVQPLVLLLTVRRNGCRSSAILTQH